MRSLNRTQRWPRADPRQPRTWAERAPRATSKLNVDAATAHRAALTVAVHTAGDPSAGRELLEALGLLEAANCRQDYR